MGGGDCEDEGNAVPDRRASHAPALLSMLLTSLPCPLKHGLSLTLSPLLALHDGHAVSSMRPTLTHTLPHLSSLSHPLAPCETSEATSRTSGTCSDTHGVSHRKKETVIGQIGECMCDRNCHDEMEWVIQLRGPASEPPSLGKLPGLSERWFVWKKWRGRIGVCV